MFGVFKYWSGIIALACRAANSINSHIFCYVFLISASFYGEMGNAQNVINASIAGLASKLSSFRIALRATGTFFIATIFPHSNNRLG